MKSLVIVESPAKAKTIEKFLGKSYRVAASLGHVRDLPRSRLGVDVEHGFEPTYITIRGKGETIKRLREEARKADRVLLATDPDREGEAISWHLADLLAIDGSSECRVTFREITREAVREAIRRPRPIDRRLVEAQQARRVLDRLVGYSLSPLLWRKVRRGLSAGRVQSVAVRLIVDREADIEAFQPEEYWTLDARLATAQDGAVFVARFHERGGQKVQLQNEDQVRALVASLDGLPFRVAKVQRRERRRTAPAPFTTSTLQQEASRKLGFTVRRTMRVAQELYEGLEIAGEGSVGLITYMRTDSTRVSAEAQAEAEAYVRQRWGGDFAAPRSGRVPAGAQDAHEAIRPTSVWRVPEALERDLTRDQYRLYRLIWERFLASQMSAAVYDTVTAVVEAGDASFRATGATLRFPGYAVLYVEGQDEGQQEEAAGALPDLEEGQELRLVAWDPRQHFTEPPPRYSEAMLVKALEEKGIGRPSTYAPIIETIVDRGYVVRQRRRFQPTELGRLVTELLKEHFPEIVSVEFTAQMESRLDAVEAGEVEWRSVVEGFYRRFQPLLERAEAVIERVELPVEETGERCELCDRPMVVKFGRYGKFLACSGYPACKHTRPYLERVGVLCPQCGGDVVERVSRKGRRFYGCKNYPTCNFVSWQRPIAERCPRCGSWMVERTRRGQTFHVCADQACGYAVPVDGEREPVNV